MFGFNLFSKELSTCLGYEFQDTSFQMFLIFSLKATLVLHILLARWYKAFTHAVFMGYGV